MFQNLKVDIIYYKTNTDFEMEFNLCGCCRMRLLTDKSPDRKTALHSLSRAVSRSRIIIMTGALFGEDGIMELVAKAIGSKLEAIDNKTYGLSGTEPIEILKGATPLVTSEGYFGGCIIESGPQTMILLSENKSIRKTVMQTLIHPYIEQLCAIELNEKAAATVDNSHSVLESVSPETAIPEPPSEEPSVEVSDIPLITDEAEEENFVEIDGLLVSESDENTEETPLVSEEEFDALASALYANTESSAEMPTVYEIDSAEADAVISDGMIFDNDHDINTTAYTNPIDAEALFIKSEPADISSIPRIRPDAEQAEEYLWDDYYDKKSHASLNIFILLIAVFLLIALAVLCYCIFYVPSKNGVDAAEYIRETFNVLFGKA